ncbi:MAG: pyruvate:ferredoxin (flavodoxin) oxidoreductase [Armatimonadetes bacterium]|nr:pyruvate:ferredoxin (flavodoxin) oxidoreductase [Armatimonadota bacterium]
MTERKKITIDGNEAAASVAHRLSEVIAIYPITPSSNMGELADQWSAEGKKNIWGTIPLVVEMQSEGGASGAVHGALQTGALSTTFTASQGLLLMIPNMYKIAGELTSTVFHVSARSVAAHALSIFGDHSDVMAIRGTGWAMLCSGSVQEAMDMAAIAHSATLESRVPFLHFFDGFRTSHEVLKIEMLNDDDLQAMVGDDPVHAHRARALSPESPKLRGTAQNPDVFFQAREAANPYYDRCAGLVQEAMDKFAALTGRAYRLFDYVGAPDAERVIVMMGSGAEVAHEAVEYMNARGEKVGLVKVRLFRPFSAEAFLKAIPATAKSIAVLDRCKEAGSAGEPLYQDILTALGEALVRGVSPFGGTIPRVVGGRYGLSSKEFTPAMVKGVFDGLREEALKATTPQHFTIGIEDDVTHLSLPYDPNFITEGDDIVRAMFFGLGADGTVGANKNSIKIIGEDTDNNAQGYFVYDSKKSGSMTVSHLRFGPSTIRSSYLISSANFVACHQFNFLERINVLEAAAEGAVFLLNSTFGPDEVWDQLPRPVQEQIIAKKLRFFVIDGYHVAKNAGMGNRINTVMQTCFFAISGVLPREEAIERIKYAVRKTYGRRGEAVVQRNFEAIDSALAQLHEVEVPARATSTVDLKPAFSDEAPDFIKNVLGSIFGGKGDALPVSAMPADGTFPTATSQWEKRNISLEIPVWDENTCAQCGKCILVCPHAVIRSKIYDPALLSGAPATFKSTGAKWTEFKGQSFTLQTAPEDCTGCGLCVEACPVKNKTEVRLKAINMAPQPPIRESENENWKFFLGLPEVERGRLKVNMVKDVQLLQPLFEFSGACAGCGETPYLKLMSQLFGDRAIVANATGCSSIYGGNLPTTPWARNADGRGPSWSNSLFEDNAEFGLGFRLTIDKHREYAGELLQKLSGQLSEDLARRLLETAQLTESGIAQQRGNVAELKAALASIDSDDARNLLSVADTLVRRSVWIVGGDGWAYDIGYGGLDHVLASGRDVNILVLDTEVYSNTGGQMSKATPKGAVAKFAAGGKRQGKKELGLFAMAYGNVYVAKVALGANDGHTIRAFLEAESYPGPSIIIAYSHCIAHGYDLRLGLEQQKNAVNSGYWPLYRYNPAIRADGKNPFILDSKKPALPVEKYMYNETRFKMLTQMDPEAAARLLGEAQQEIDDRYAQLEYLAGQ